MKAVVLKKQVSLVFTVVGEIQALLWHVELAGPPAAAFNSAVGHSNSTFTQATVGINRICGALSLNTCNKQ